MSASRRVITPWWLSGSWKPFLYRSSVYSCLLFLESSASVRSILFLTFIVPILACSVPLLSLIFLKRPLVFPIPLFSPKYFGWDKAFSSGGKGGNRGWDGWMASSTQWTWVWANSGAQWRTGRPDVLQSRGSQ